ncbi:MAG: type II toxin-antitoxin system VapC family toxin [Actinomycetota bacterium]
MNLALDSSAIVKLVVDEEASDVAHRLWEEAAGRFASTLAYPETRAALAAARRADRLTARAERTAISALDERWEALVVVAVSEPLALSAGDLARKFALRGGDAVHLVTAIEARADEILLATWDRDLAKAGLRAGLAVAPAVKQR